MKTIDSAAITEVAGGYVPLLVINYWEYPQDISNAPWYRGVLN